MPALSGCSHAYGEGTGQRPEDKPAVVETVPGLAGAGTGRAIAPNAGDAQSGISSDEEPRGNQ